MITSTGSLCSNILNEETAFTPFQKNSGNFILSNVYLPCCVYFFWEHKWRDLRNRCCSLLRAGGGVQCNSQENTSINPQNNTPPRPALFLLLAPARQHVCVMQVCAWCGRRCNIVHVVRHIRGGGWRDTACDPGSRASVLSSSGHLESSLMGVICKSWKVLSKYQN